jgi:hypothetical protein
MNQATLMSVTAAALSLGFSLQPHPAPFWEANVVIAAEETSPRNVEKVKTADDEDSRIRSPWREDHGNADWYDGRQDDRAEALKQYSYRPPSDDSDCFTVERVWYCP